MWAINQTRFQGGLFAYVLRVTDVLLTDADEKAALSIAYVQAIAARAGYTCGDPPQPDRDSVDITVSAGGRMRPKLDIQCKATINLAASEGEFRFPLKKKNYDDLRIETQTPRILVVLRLPDDDAQWLHVSHDELILRTAAYWLSLRGYEEADSTTTVTVSIPRSNLFDIECVRTLMEKSRAGSVT